MRYLRTIFFSHTFQRNPNDDTILNPIAIYLTLFKSNKLIKLSRVVWIRQHLAVKSTCSTYLSCNVILLRNCDCPYAIKLRKRACPSPMFGVRLPKDINSSLLFLTLKWTRVPEKETNN